MTRQRDDSVSETNNDVEASSNTPGLDPCEIEKEGENSLPPLSTPHEVDPEEVRELKEVIKSLQFELRLERSRFFRLPLWAKRLVLAQREKNETPDPMQMSVEEHKKHRYFLVTQRQRLYSKHLVWILVVQLVVANFFLWKEATDEAFHLNDQVWIAFMTAVIAEVIGLVYGVVKGTFVADGESTTDKKNNAG